jgi:hypothetical protein
MKKGDKVIAPKGCNSYLTEGKEYEVLNINTGSEYYGIMFSTISDTGYEIFCFERKCGHLNHQDWIIPTNEETPDYRHWKNQQLDLDTDYHSGARTGMIIGVVLGGSIGLLIGALIGLIF